VSRVFITGSSDGLGLAAATLLLLQGHEVVGHARNAGRAAELRAAAPGVADVAIGDLSGAAETRSVADQVNALGRFDAVIHNAGVGYRESRKVTTVDGHAHLLAILGPVTQAWLAVSDDPAATVSGQLFYHQRPREAHPAARSRQFQDELLGALAELTGTKLPD